MPSQPSNDAQVREELTITSRWLLAATITGLALILLRFLVASGFSIYHNQGWVVQGKVFTSLLWAVGWFAVAFVFGFIFGVPKVLQTPAPSKTDPNTTTASTNPNAEMPGRLRVNTNLEEISDWLTKILVGATLTQLIKIPGLVRAAAEYMATDVGDPTYETFAAAILLYFTSVGFLAGYILTRTFFSRQFERSAQAPLFTPEDKEALKSQPLALGYQTQVTTDVQTAVNKSGEVEITSALSGPEASAIATASLLSGNFFRALQASSQALSKDPEDPRSHLNHALALYNINPQNPAVLKELEDTYQKMSDAKQDPRTAEDLCNSIAYLALYLPQPQGFEKTIQYVESFISQMKPSGPSLYINLAAAYGQMHAYYKQADPQKAKIARDKALAAVKAAKDADPDSTPRLRELYHGTGLDPSDSDLKTFEGDPDFEKELGQ